jgi:sulfatase modifying factor 1
MHLAETCADRPAAWEVEWRVIDVACEVAQLDRAVVTPDATLLDDLGLDSMAVVEFVMGLEEAFDVTLPDDVVSGFFSRGPTTLRTVAQMVLHRWGTGAAVRECWRATPLPLPPVASTPFTQLGGCLAPGDWLVGPLYAPLGINREGYVELRRRTDGMRCVLIPEAEVRIGPADPEALPDQQPSHRVHVREFLIDAEPVSCASFARFLNSVGTVAASVLAEWCGVADRDARKAQFPLRRAGAIWQPIRVTARLPMILVSWYGANAYSLWANCCDWRAYRGDEKCMPELEGNVVQVPPAGCRLSCLPSEAEWEYAARGTEPRRYPWGDEVPTLDRARVAQHVAGATYAADALPAAEVSERLGMSPFGVHHMAGNVWQWCRDWYAPEFYHRPEASAPDAENACPTGVRSERGGSWVGPGELACSSYRRGRPPQARGRCLGFRCVGARALTTAQAPARSSPPCLPPSPAR